MRALAIAITITLGLGVALGAVAHADSPPLIQAPAGWLADPGAATSLAAKANHVPHFGGVTALATTDVFLAPAPGVALFVTAVAGKVTTERDAAAREAVDELHASFQRAALAGSGIVEDGWQEKADPAHKQIEATLSWRDPAGGTSTHARLVVVADAEHVIAVTGECIVGEGAGQPLVAACRAALATLDPGVPADRRVALALAPPESRPATTSAAGVNPAASTSGAAEPRAATHTPLPPMAVRQEDRSVDRRPVYVGAGLVVLAAVFWWNRRRRARFEKESHHE